MGELIRTYLRLGLTSFGGPIAHLGYFHRELVERRRWVSESEYAQLIAICQFLPGPASSQLGFALGLLRAGWWGAIAAFLLFTLPSALLLFFFATVVPNLSDGWQYEAVRSLELVALVVVAHGLRGLAARLCPDAPRVMIAGLAAVGILLAGSAWLQLLVVALGAVAGVLFCRDVEIVGDSPLPLRYGPRLGAVFLVLFALFLVGLPLIAELNELAAVGSAFYRAGALVFGGGHVVLPLLEETVVGPGWLGAEEFLAGYGAAQAVPGPMFSISAFLGASLPGAMGGAVGAGVAVLAIFLPGMLLISGVLPVWNVIARQRRAPRAIAGVNAAVVGLLGAALYDPVWVNAVRGSTDLAIAIVGFSLVAAWRVSPLIVVLWCVGASVAAYSFGLTP